MSLWIPLHFWWLGFLSFAASSLAHILYWRFGSSRSVQTLFVILIGAPIVCYGVTGLLAGYETLWWAIPPSITHFLLAANYIAIYPAFQASSPTVNILDMVHRSKNGMTPEEIREKLGNATVSDRICDLERANFIFMDGDQPRLTWRGEILSTAFILFRKTLRLSQGEG